MFGTIALNFFTDSSDTDSEDASTYRKPARKYHISQDRLQNLQRLNCSSKDDARLQRRILRDETNVLELSEEQFIRNFRVSKLVFIKVLEELTPKMQNTYRSTHVPAPIKLAKFLEFVATGVSTAGNKCASVMSKSQVSRVICEMLDLFEQNMYTKWVILEQNEDDENTTKQHFQNISGIEDVVGCVDNTHIRIKTPEKDVRELYNNYQGFPSLNVLMMCDHNMLIKYVDASQPGSFPDAYVWDQSCADNYFRTNYVNGKTNSLLIGNSAHKLLPYLMIPYKNPIEDYQKMFNQKIIKASAIMKQCVKMLKKRFNCLITPKGLQYSPEKAVKIVISCCILHNICIAYKHLWLPPDTDTSQEIRNDEDDIVEIFNEECTESTCVRDEIALKAFLMAQIPTAPEESNSENPSYVSRLRQATDILDFPDNKYMKIFGVSKEVFSVLLEEITPQLKASYRITHIPPSIKLATFLEFIAGSAHVSNIDFEYTRNISKSSKSRIICEMLDIFAEHLHGKWIKLEQTLQDENLVKEHFYQSTGLSGVIGCVDNIHIQIKTPPKNVKKLFFNRKSFYSLNVMMICDHNMAIKYVDADQPGSYYDAYVWDQSSAEYFVRQKTNCWLIGDSAYKLQPYMMIPYKQPKEHHEHKFNQRHFEARKVIRKCFCILKNRFKCLSSSTGLQYTTEKASKIIISCCILHNVCISYKNYWPNSDIVCDDIEDDDEENIIESPNIERATCMRDKIAIKLL